MESTERVREGIALLFDNFWLTRKYDLDKYMVIRQNRKEIQKYFNDNFGYQLILNNSVAKLEKVPSEPEVWMGIQEFSDTLDYVIFTAILSYLEDKSSEDIFIVSMLSEYIKQFLSQIYPIKWEIYRHRLSFVRAMKVAEKFYLVDVMEGEINLYKDDETIEVLYRPSLISKYYTRFFSKPIQQMESREELLEDRWKISGYLNAKFRRQSLSRKLLSSPVVYRSELDDEEKKYFSNYGYSIIDAFEEFTPFEVETYRNEILLIAKERNPHTKQYPDGKMISQIALQFGVLVQNLVNEQDEMPDFEWEIPRYVFNKWMATLQNENGHGWSKEYRDKDAEEISTELIQYLTEWKCIKEDLKALSISIYPVITRIGGQYPIEYQFQRYFITRLKGLMEPIDSEQLHFELSISELENWINDFKSEKGIKVFNWKRVEDSIGSIASISEDRNQCSIDLIKVRKKDAK